MTRNLLFKPERCIVRVHFTVKFVRVEEIDMISDLILLFVVTLKD